MLIRNVMEDIVYREVNKLFDAAKSRGDKWLICDCMQCRLDCMCYVLNRIEPRYIKSSRGLVYFFQLDDESGKQLIADVYSTIVEGMKIIQTRQRPHTYSHSEDADNYENVFNFPVIRGRILDGKNLKPMSDVSVKLYNGKELVNQMEVLWDNPYVISEKTAGTYAFWPKVEPSEETGEKKDFNFILIAEKDGYDSVKKCFTISLESEKNINRGFDLTKHYKMADISLFEGNDSET